MAGPADRFVMSESGDSHRRRDPSSPPRLRGVTRDTALMTDYEALSAWSSAGSAPMTQTMIAAIAAF